MSMISKKLLLILVLVGCLCACTNPVSKDGLDAQIPREGESSSKALSGQPLIPEDTANGDSGQSEE